MARVEANWSEGSEVVEGELALANVVIGRCTSWCDRRNGRSEPEVIEDAGGDVGGA